MIGFISRMNSAASLKPGFRYFQYENAMTKVSRPDFALKEGADLVIGADGTAILAPYSFQTLLGDVGVSFDHVQKDMANVRKCWREASTSPRERMKRFWPRHPAPSAWPNDSDCFLTA